MKDWKAIAKAAGLEVTGPELERISKALSGLEETFQPLLKDLPPEVEPATVFSVAETGE